MSYGVIPCTWGPSTCEVHHGHLFHLWTLRGMYFGCTSDILWCRLILSWLQRPMCKTLVWTAHFNSLNALSYDATWQLLMQFHAIMVVEHTCNAGFDEWAYHYVTREQRVVKGKYYTGDMWQDAPCLLNGAPLARSRASLWCHIMSYDIIWHHSDANLKIPKIDITCNQLSLWTLTPLQISTCRNFRWRLGCCGDMRRSISLAPKPIRNNVVG